MPLARTQGRGGARRAQLLQLRRARLPHGADRGAGLVGLGFTNAPASIAPWGALKPVLGTNPWSLAVPGADGAAFVIDQSASVVAKSEVMKRARAGEPLPEGWALDAEGRPTTDAQAALKGTMMPSGGAEGRQCRAAGGGDGGLPRRRDAGRAGQPVLRPVRRAAADRAVLPRPRSRRVLGRRVRRPARRPCSPPSPHEPGSRLPGARRRAARARAEREGVAVDAALLAPRAAACCHDPPARNR